MSYIFAILNAPDNNLREDWDSDIKFAGKVYRKTYGAQKETPYFLAAKGEFIPEELQSPLLSDQTFRYHQTVTLRIPLSLRTSTNLVYLAMFTTDNTLVSVGWGKIDQEKQEMVFEQVPLNTLFFPVCYDDEDVLPIADPFIIRSTNEPKDISLPLTINKQSKHIVDLSVTANRLFYTEKKNKQPQHLLYQTLLCDTTHKIQMHLMRKYPEKRRMQIFYEKLKGACLLGGNEERGTYDTLLILKEAPVPYLQECRLENKKSYRYYRFRTQGGEPINIAHLEFLGNYSVKHTCVKPTPLPVFSDSELATNKPSVLFSIKGIPMRTGSKAEYAFDGDFNTYVGASSIGMDFNTPVCVSRIRFIPRNANNMIVLGHSYMLLYFDSSKWVEYKILYAEHNFLNFEDVPVATLYWLKNLTEGQEELPFFYVNGRQYFLHIDHPPL